MRIVSPFVAMSILCSYRENMGGFLKKTVKYALVRANLEAKKIILKLFFLQFRPFTEKIPGV